MSAALLRLRWVLLYFVSRAGLLLPRRLIPTRLAYAVAVRVADVCFLCFWRPRRNLIANLRPVVGDERAPQVARSAFRHYARYIIDLFQLPVLGIETVRARTRFDAWGELDAVIAEGKGTIVVTLHFGQQESGPAALAAHGYRMSVVARTLEFGPIDGLIKEFRQALGMRIIPAERPALATFRCLTRNEVLGMLIDQVDEGEGVVVDFLGGRAEMSSAPARVALRSGARVVPAVVVRDPEDDTRYLPVIDTSLTFERTGNEEADILALTQQIASSFEGVVRRYPDQWFAFRRVWRNGAARERATNWNDRFNHFALEAANLLFRDLPKPVSYAIANVVGDAAFVLRRGIRADVEDNMRHVLGPAAPAREVRACVREVFRNVCRYYADLIRLPRTRPERLMSLEMTVEGLDRLRAAMAGGRGAVVATAHFGNPEVAVQISHLLGLDVLVLSEPLNPPAFNDLVHRLRESQGIRYEEVGFKTIGHALQHLRRGGVLAITCDRDIQETGVLLPFFGEETRMPLGAAEMAARTGAALVPAICRREGNRYRIVFEDPIALVSTGRAKPDAIINTQAMIARMESWIRADPGQWFVLERIWKRRRGGRAGAANGAKMAAPAPETAGARRES
ncbi:MAG TPA: lysophospholipid acyltransferase family protein [Dehalococcoidia bacterium]|nr:lysophospholipid acyltransferase family protein [Dehalococcoidia bacterium]